MTIRTRIAVPVALVALFACGGDDGPTGPGGPAQLTITTTSLPDAFANRPYTEAIDAQGGDAAYNWTVSAGALPPGLALSVEDLNAGDDVVVTGTPDAEGTYSFTVQVTSGDGQSASRAFTIEVMPEPGPISIDRLLLPPGLVGLSYNVLLRASGGTGTYAWSVAGGSLPAGLSLSSSGRIQGTPGGTDTAAVDIRVVSGADTTTQSYTIQVLANRTGGYHVTALPVVPVPAGVQPHLDAAMARIESFITGNLSAVPISAGFFTGSDCGGFGDAANGGAVDDILILVNITPIDGPARTLAQAGPCGIRGNDLPFVGILTFDSDDLVGVIGTDWLTEIIVHEMAHVLGYGSLWELVGLITGAGGADPRYTGSAAVAAWQALGGTGSVPVEGTPAGPGTADSHWRETTFDEELLTGFAEPVGVNQPLSAMSVASFSDLGYAVNLAAAEPYVLVPPAGAAGAAARLADSPGHDHVLRDPVRVLEPDGTSRLVPLEGSP